MKPTFFKGVVLGAVIAAVVSAGAVGFGAVTPFNLNTTANTVSAPTAASGSIAGNQVTLTDNSTSSGAPLALTNNSTATGATALKLTVKAGKAPLTVNSGTKVTNLNVDRVDGIDSTGLIQGKGHVYTLAVAIPRGPNSSTYTPSPAAAPGFFNVQFLCPGRNTDLSAELQFIDLASDYENLFFRNSAFPSAQFDFVIPNSSTSVVTDNAADLTTATVNGLPGGVETTSTMTIATAVHNADCYFQIQALTTHQ